MRHLFKTYSELCKVWISFFTAFSAATGYFLSPGSHQGSMMITLTGVFLLACGASALNQVQERDIDGHMERTCRRPLPSGRITPFHGFVVSFALASIGLFLLHTNSGRSAALLGLFALLWYNAVYTYLKRITAFAAVPGALVGAIPPAIGWVSAGGSIADPRLLALCFIFFMWQVPHFWLLILRHGKEYENAGLPSLTRVMGRNQIARITFAWIVAAAGATLALPLYGSVRSPLIFFSFFPLALWLIWKGRSLTGNNGPLTATPLLFRTMNLYLFIMMSLLCLESVLSPLP
jgi:protoheme IX farnesyltransferase